jgi:uncharacterized RDD family membrane protein YckC
MNVSEPPGTGWVAPDPNLGTTAPVPAQPPWTTEPPPWTAAPPPWATGLPPTAAPPQERPGRRVSAALVDIALLCGVFLILGLASGRTPAATLPPGTLNVTVGVVYVSTWSLRFGEATVAGWWLAGYLAVVLLYYFVLEAATGQTLGKRLLGLRVTSGDGTRPSAAAVAARTLLRLVDWLPLLYLAGFITVLATGRDRRQRLGDLAARTRVAAGPEVSAERWPAVLAGILAGLVILGLSVRVTTGGPAGQVSATAVHPCHGVSFYRPARWLEGPAQEHDVGNAALCRTGLFIGPSDGIVVSAYRLLGPVTAANMGVITPTITSAVRQAAAGTGGRLLVGPQRTTVGGLPALRFQFPGHSYSGTPVTSTIVIAFDRSTEYEINCQQSRAHAAQVTWACGQVLRTFRAPGSPAVPAPGATPAPAGSPQRWERGLGSLEQQMNNAMPSGTMTAASLRRGAATLRLCTLELTRLGRPASVLRPTYRLARRACAAFEQAAAAATAAAGGIATASPSNRKENKLLNRMGAAVNRGISLIDHAFYGAPVLPPGYP